MRGSLRSLIGVSVLVILPGAATGAAAAQPAAATLAGTVIAGDNARLPGAALRLRHLQTGEAFDGVSSDAGLFRIDGLPPGGYELHASLAGFETLRIEAIVLRPGEVLSMVVRLDLASIRETIRVVGVAAADTVEAFEMRESRARDLGEALAQLPGLVKSRKGAIANDVVLRGFQGKDVTLLIDGQRLDGACPSHMDPPAFHVDFAEVARVEVSRGPFDVKNQGGFAGIVNVVTDRPQRGWHGAASLSLGSADTLSASASSSIGGSGWAALAGASARRADVYRDGAGRRITDGAGYASAAADDRAAYDVWTAWGRLALTPAAGAGFQLSYTRQSAGEMLYPYLQMDALFDRADRAGARFELADVGAGWQGLATHVYFTRVDHWMTDTLRVSGLGRPREYSMGTRAKTWIAGGRAEIQRGPVVAGVEASRRNWQTSTMLAMLNYAPQAALPDVTIDVGGLFVTWSPIARGRIAVETGARLDVAESRADAGLANVALYESYHGTRATRAADVLPAGFVRARWRETNGWSATVGLGHSTRLPDQQERFYALRRMGSDWVGNPGLSPGRNTGLDGELRLTRGGFDAGISAYLYAVQDAITIVERPRAIAVPGYPNATARSFGNADAIVRGLEATATLPLAPSLFLSVDGTWVRGTFQGVPADRRNMPEIPPAKGRMRLRFDNTTWHAALEVIGSTRQRAIAVYLRETPTAAFALANLTLGWKRGLLTVTAAADNLLDARYLEHLSYQRDPFRTGSRVYEPGRTLWLNVSGRF